MFNPPPPPSPVSAGTWHLHDARLTGLRRVEHVHLSRVQTPRQQTSNGPPNPNTTSPAVPSNTVYARLPDSSDMYENLPRTNARMLRPPPYKYPIQVLKAIFRSPV